MRVVASQPLTRKASPLSNPVLTQAVNRIQSGPAGSLTYEHVKRRGALAMLALITSSLLTWGYFSGVLAMNPEQASMAWGFSIGASLVTLVWILVAAFLLRRVGPVTALGITVLEGAGLGAFSAIFSSAFGLDVVGSALIGTIAGLVGTFIAHSAFGVRVSAKARRVVITVAWSMIVLALFSIICAILGFPLGLFGIGPLGAITAVIGVGIAIFFLLMDFDDISDAVNSGAPVEESWGLVLGLVLSIVWLYTDLLRLVTIFDEDNPLRW